MGKLIAIEGGDGSGKATQAKQLVTRLSKSGYDVLMASFPNYGSPSARFIEEYLNGNYGDATKIAPQLASMLFAIDRFALRDNMRAHLEKPKGIVVTDRYVASNLAYQGAKIADFAARQAFYHDVREIEYEILGLPEPTTNIILVVDAITAQANMQERGARAYTTKFHDDHERDADYLTRANQAYNELANEYPELFQAITCTDASGSMRSVQSIADDVWRLVAPIL